LLGEFPAVERVLREILKLKCSGSCRESPHSELGCAVNCSIRRCVMERKLAGCWECAERHSCDQIRRMATFHPGIRVNLESIAKYGIESWLEHRGRHYNWGTGGSDAE
jgi:hypothetical protein